MKITVEGVTIELTPEQVATVAKEKQKRDASCKSFVSVLKYFGFTKVLVTANSICYEHKEYGWFAEVYPACVHSHDCWMAGNGLRNGGFPGGYVYGSPEAVRDALVEAIDNIGGKT